jgi:hypothetical protein
VRNKHIGDSLDLAKRRLLELAASLNMGTLVAPLPCQRDFRFDLYKMVLGAETPHGVHGSDAVRFSGRKRQQHLDNLQAALSKGPYKAVLLDPDSGLRRDHGNSSKFVSLAEAKLIIRGSHLTWLLYHHQSAGKLSYEDVIALLGAAGAYNFGKAAVVVGGAEAQASNLISAVHESLNPKHWISASNRRCG